MLRRQDFIHVDVNVDGDDGLTTRCLSGRRITGRPDCRQSVLVDSHMTGRSTYYVDGVPHNGLATFSDDDRPRQKSVVVDDDCCQYYERPLIVRRTTDARHRSVSRDDTATWNADHLQCPVYYNEHVSAPPMSAVGASSRLTVSLSLNLKVFNKPDCLLTKIMQDSNR